MEKTLNGWTMSDFRIDQFKITAPMTPGLREAIGAVCVHWALLELMIERVVAFQTKQSIDVAYDNDFGGNMDLLENYRKKRRRTLDPAVAAKWAELIEAGRKLAKERHRIVHGFGASSNEFGPSRCNLAAASLDDSPSAPDPSARASVAASWLQYACSREGPPIR